MGKEEGLRPCYLQPEGRAARVRHKWVSEPMNNLALRLLLKNWDIILILKGPTGQIAKLTELCCFLRPPRNCPDLACLPWLCSCVCLASLIDPKSLVALNLISIPLFSFHFYLAVSKQQEFPNHVWNKWLKSRRSLENQAVAFLEGKKKPTESRSAEPATIKSVLLIEKANIT